MHSDGHAMNRESPMIAHEPVLGLEAVCSRAIVEAIVNDDECPGVSTQLYLLRS
jgi:hypothetical protein